QGWLVELVRALLARRGSSVALQANMRADLVTEELCAALGEYGADKLRLRIAVETGNEDYRRQILKKNISDDELLRAADTLNRYGIDFVTYNMLGLPGESYAEAIKTLRFNCRMKPVLALCFVFQPFPGTELARYAVEKGLLPPENLSKMGTAEYGGFFFSRSPLIQPEIEKIENLHAVFGFVVEHPFLLPVASQLCRIEALAPLFRVFYRAYLRRLLARRRARDSY
ncbi:MAG: radical SAM protein, partial [Acidobacteria bacterium]|nr:radical SAM protein [Acidobacteriota bacterium]